jgi:enamine deaminase RidA (YjgF/YER057c/UK114 family)
MSEMERSRIQPPDLLTPKSYPFSWGMRVRSGELLFIAGQVSTDMDRNVIGPGDMAAQTRQVFKNMGPVLAEAGASFSNIVELTTYLVGRDKLEAHVAAINELFPSLFPDGVYPANTLVFIDGLYREEFLLEVKAIAVLH